MKKVFISTSSFAAYDKRPVTLLEENNLKVTLNPHGKKLTREQISSILPDYNYLIAGTEPLSKDLLEKCPSLEIISRCGTGMDNVDIDAAKDLGIKVFNTPDAPTLAVAELTLAFILDLLRKVNEMDSDIRNGIWKKKMGNLLHGKKIGIIGFGRIGQKAGALLSAFGTELAYCDMAPQVCSFNCGEKQFDNILGWADIITLHISPPRDCGPVIGDKELKLMKKGSLLINVSRGGIVDEDALYRALKEGHLAGAALDVFEREPYSGPLTELNNIILTPHIGSYAKEARVQMETEAVNNLLKGLSGT